MNLLSRVYNQYCNYRISTDAKGYYTITFESVIPYSVLFPRRNNHDPLDALEIYMSIIDKGNREMVFPVTKALGYRVWNSYTPGLTHLLSVGFDSKEEAENVMKEISRIGGMEWQKIKTI